MTIGYEHTREPRRTPQCQCSNADSGRELIGGCEGVSVRSSSCGRVKSRGRIRQTYPKRPTAS